MLLRLQLQESIMNVSQLCDKYLSDHARFKKTAAGDRHLIEKHIRPNFGTKAVTIVRYTDISKIHASMQETPYQANRVLALLSAMFNLADLWDIELPKGNPCRKVKRYAEKKRVRYLNDDEIRCLIALIERHGDQHPRNANLILFLLYTGCRLGEALSATWNDVQGDELHLIESKTGQRVIYLTPQAKTILDRMALVGSGAGKIFPFVNPRYSWAAILKVSGFTNLRIHDLRHCFASIGISSGESLARVGMLLGHSNPRQTATYAHLVPSEGRAAALAIGARFNQITS